MSHLRRRFRPRDGRDVFQAFAPDRDNTTVHFSDIARACHAWLMKRDPSYRTEYERNRSQALRSKRHPATP